MARKPIFPALLLLSATLQATANWQSCRSISNDDTRLACYDKYALTLGRQAAPPTLEQQKAAFGLPKRSPAGQLQNISSQIARIEKTTHGARIFYLQNEQVWRQIGSHSQPRLKTGDNIMIERRALGAFSMKKQGSNRSLRVKRIKN